MAGHFRKAYILTPVVYIVVLISLVLLQFSNDELYQTSVGEFSVSGAIDPALDRDEGTRAFRDLYAAFGPIRLLFAGERGVSLLSAEGALSAGRVASFEEDDGEVRVSMEGGVTLRLTPTDGGMTLHIARDPESSNVRAVRVPYSVPSGYSAVATERPNSVALSSGSDTITILLPSGAVFQPDIPAFDVPLGLHPSSIAFFEEVIPSEDLSRRRLELGLSSLAAGAPEDAVREWSDRAYQGWAAGRFRASTGTWLFAEGGHRFSEAALVAYLSEAWQRGDYDAALADMRAAADRSPSRLTYRSSVFLGSMMRQLPGMAASDAERAAQLRESIAQQNPRLFLESDVLAFAANRGDQELLRNIQRLSENTSLSDVDLPVLVGMMHNAYLGSLSGAFLELRERVRPLVAGRILPWISTGDGWALPVDDEGVADLSLSLRLAAVLDAIGTAEGDRFLTELGGAIRTTCLGLSDENGVMPAFVTVEGPQIVARTGALYPEDVYTMVRENPRYPQEVSLYRDVGPGVWAFTVADIQVVEVTDTDIRLRVASTPDRTHYLYIRGVPGIDPETGIEMFSYVWRDDPQFERYRRGRHYDAASRTLMVKYANEEPATEIVLKPRSAQ